MKGRTTSWEERIEIVRYCIAHGKDYQKAVSQKKMGMSQTNKDCGFFLEPIKTEINTLLGFTWIIIEDYHP